MQKMKTKQKFPFRKRSTYGFGCLLKWMGIISLVLLATCWMLYLFVLPLMPCCRSKSRQHLPTVSGTTGEEQDVKEILAKTNVIELASQVSHSTKEQVEPGSRDTNVAASATRKSLDEHSIHHMTKEEVAAHPGLEDVMVFMKERSCRHLPIFITMANVGSLLYWQMIENFVYSMVKFGLSNCSLMVCVTDAHCMEMCRRSGFPCFDFHFNRLFPDKQIPSPMEQIAVLKLLVIPRALQRGVDVFTLDLDVGFVESPLKLVEQMSSRPHLDVLLQKDISFVMHRSVELWRTWFTVDLPNIGILLCKGNERTVEVFENAWRDYQTSDVAIRKNPGKDQNKVVNALQASRKVKWGYFERNSTILLDKIYKYHNMSVELGGEVAEELMRDNEVVAVHTTCYEHQTKVMGLKATNSFWNPFYYFPERRTITKKLVFFHINQLQEELRSLYYLGLVTNRAVIVPNLLGIDDMESVLPQQERRLWPGFRVGKLGPNKGIPLFEALFRTESESSLVQENDNDKESGAHSDHVKSLEVLEPAYYWRVRRDYARGPIPPPRIITYTKAEKLGDIEARLLAPEVAGEPRLVLDGRLPFKKYLQLARFKLDQNGNGNRFNETGIEEELDRLAKNWAEHSYSGYSDFKTEKDAYVKLPNTVVYGSPARVTKPSVLKAVVAEVRPCAKIFHAIQGNRSCFDKCK